MWREPVWQLQHVEQPLHDFEMNIWQDKCGVFHLGEHQTSSRSRGWNFIPQRVTCKEKMKQNEQSRGGVLRRKAQREVTQSLLVKQKSAQGWIWSVIQCNTVQPHSIIASAAEKRLWTTTTSNTKWIQKLHTEIGMYQYWILSIDA